MEISKKEHDLISSYIGKALESDDNEFECSFNSIQRTDFDNVINYLRKSKAFTFDKQVQENLDVSLLLDNSNYRVMIHGHQNMIDYCKTNKLKAFTLMKKEMMKDFEKIKLPEYDIIFRLKKEVHIDRNDLDDNFENYFTDSEKHFRNKKRFSFLHESKLFRVDLTVVKSSMKVSKTVKDSGVLKSTDKFEIEVEYLNIPHKDTIDILFNIIEVIKKTLENTSHLITKHMKELILCDYLQLVNPKFFDTCESKIFDHIRNRVLKRPKEYFLSYQPITLEQSNLLPTKLGRISILTNYTVTEKADGERMLLYVDKNNKMYLIDSRLNVRYTGEKHKYTNSLLDCEFVKKSKINTFINYLLCFDVYFLNGEDVRSNALVPNRLDLIATFCKQHNNTSSTFKIKPKTFHYGDDILKLCKKAYNTDSYDYHIDGLIFTPRENYVGSYYKNENANTNTFGGAWMNVLKWKPPEENSIDMLISYGQNMFVENVGRCVFAKLQVAYKTNADELINPIKVLSNNLTIEKSSYITKTFVEVYLKLEDNAKYPKTLLNENIYNNTIVEFIHDALKSPQFCWIPYRVRQDKTELYSKTKNILNTANSYTTASNVWRSIQNPVTVDMITGNKMLDEKDILENDVYYSRFVSRAKILSKSMLTFHNKGVKSKLFELFKNKNYSLIDLASGKAGDLFKWMENRFRLVVGVDINYDNILNQYDGAYKRLVDIKKMNHATSVIFLQKDVSIPWDETSDIQNEMLKYFYNALWGNIPRNEIKDVSLLKFYNKLNGGFDVVSCQFAIHYMFRDDESLEAFCDNVDKVLNTNGYFIGTCMDGNKVNTLLSKSKDGVSEGIYKDNVLWMIEKKYDKYVPKKTGQKIGVFVESINQVLDEYLVDIDLLIEKLKERNIRTLDADELKKLDIKNSIQNFELLYNEDEYSLLEPLKQYSFLNLWFVFKKYE